MIIQQGLVGITRQQATTNTAAQLDITARKANKVDDGAGVAQAVYISAEGADIRYAFGVDPDTAGLGHLLADGDSVRVVGSQNVEGIKVVSAVADTPATLHISSEFGNGVTITA